MADGEEAEKKIVVEAGGDEEKQIVLVGAGDEEEEERNVGGGEGNGNDNGNGNGNGNEARLIRPPPGFRFTPRDDELVKYYLLPKLQGREHVPNDAIIEDNVYQTHPDQLIEKHRDKGEDCWYFLSQRERKYRNGDRPSRNTKDHCGRWKASTGTKVVVIEDGGGSSKTTKSKAAQGAAGDGKIRYSESTLSYYEGAIKDESKVKWLMKEFTVPGYEKKRGKNGGGGGGAGSGMQLDQYVMCKIYVSPRYKGDDAEVGPSGTQPEPEESGQETAAGCEKLSEKQAGKRPAKDQGATPAAKRPHYPNPDRLHLGPPAPLHGHGMQAPFRPPGYYAGGPGRPMGFYARPPVPRPPFAYNSGQMHVPRQPVAYSGNGQVPVTRQPMAFNGQVQVPAPRQQMGFNGQMTPPPVLKLSPPYRPAGTPSSSGQNQTGMTRPPGPAGQAVNPPSSVQPRPAQVQKLPETDEMRANRVLQQHMEEYSRIMQLQSSTRPPASAAHAAQQQRPPAPLTHQQQHQQRPMMAFTQQQQQQQQQRPFTQQQQQQRPYFGANASYYHHPGAMVQVPRFSLENFYASEAAQHYQRSRVFPATNGYAGASTVPASAPAEGLVSSVVPGAGNEVTGANRDCSNDVEMEFVEPATAGGSAPAADGDDPKYESAE